ncbi:MAG: DUF945 family protein [Methylococcales bacterium]
MGATAFTKFQTAGFPATPQFKLQHEISTFPIYIRNDGSPGFALAYGKSTLSLDNFTATELEELKAVFNERTPVVVETILDYAWNYNLRLTINPAEDKKKLLSFSGLNGNFVVSKDGTKISGQAESRSLKSQTNEGSFNLADFEFNLDQSKNDAGLWTGIRRAQGLKESLDQQAQRVLHPNPRIVRGSAITAVCRKPADLLWMPRLRKCIKPDSPTIDVCGQTEAKTVFHKPTRDLANEMLNDWEAIFRVLQHPELPLTNNEKDTRPTAWQVILRKISYGTRTEDGSRIFAAF